MSKNPVKDLSDGFSEKRHKNDGNSNIKDSSVKKDIFPADRSREISASLNNIIRFSEMALDSDISPEAREYLDKVMENTKWLLHIIDDIPGLSKIEADSMPDELENTVLRGEVFVCKDNQMNQRTIADHAEKKWDLFEKLEPLLKSGNPECLKLIDDLRAIPESGDLIEQIEDFYFKAAARTLVKLKEKLFNESEKFKLAG